MWCVTRDCCGLVCASVTLVLMVFALMVQVVFVLGPWKGTFSFYTIFYSCFSFLSLISHITCMTQNPGAVPKCEEDYSGCRECSYCKSYKPIDAHHCRTCQQCIIRLDHHCPWVNNCVGYLNQKHFVLFLFWTAVTCLWCMITLGCRFFKCASFQKSYIRPDYCVPSPFDVICCTLNFVEAILFGLFVTVMMFDQFSVIFENTTYIDKLKGVKRQQRRNMYDSLVFTFGGDIGIPWLLPHSPSKIALNNFKSMCALPTTKPGLKQDDSSAETDKSVSTKPPLADTDAKRKKQE